MPRHTAIHPHYLAALTTLLLIGSGCRSTPGPLRLPAAEPTVRYATSATPASGAEPRQFRFELFAVAAPPAGAAVATAARAIVAHSGTPFRGRSRLPIGSLWLAGDDVARWLAAAGERDASAEQSLAKGTVLATATVAATLQFANQPLPQVRLRATGPDTAVTLVSAPDDEEAREDLPIAEPLRDGPAGLFVPDPRVPGGGKLLLLIPGERPDTVAVAAAEQQAIADEPSAGDAVPSAWRLARNAVGERNRRPALLALAGPLRLDRVIDLLLAADERSLIAIGNAVPADAGQEPDRKASGWRLERAIWRAVIPRIEREELTPAMHAAIERHLGALLHDPASLSLLLETAGGLDRFATELSDRNLAALDDRSTAVRCIAERWLRRGGVEIAGYDALDDRASRRLALRRYRQREAGR